MAVTSRKELGSIVALSGAVAAETNRAAMWALVPVRTRMQAMMIAGLDKHRAGDPLETFSYAERQQIRLALTVHMGNIEMIFDSLAGSAHATSQLFH